MQAGTQVSFAANGKSHIHLTGYLTDYDDEDGLTLEDLEEEEEQSDNVEQESGTKKRALKENGTISRCKCSGSNRLDVQMNMYFSTHFW